MVVTSVQRFFQSIMPSSVNSTVPDPSAPVGAKKNSGKSSTTSTSTSTPAVPKNGQNGFRSGLCISTHLNGERCMEKTAYKYVPYCKTCIVKGDPSMAVLPHPKFGKMLAAQRDLPRGYKMALWGTVYSEEDMPEEDKEWGFETADGMFINPVAHPSSLPQFCQCPGPHEKVTVTFHTADHLMMEEVEGTKKRKEKYGAMLFVTNQAVPKNHQLVMMYASSEKETDTFFQERGLERCDVWTKKNPTILKKNVAPKDLKLGPTANKKKPSASKKDLDKVKKKHDKE